jgi:hypothetical protein
MRQTEVTNQLFVANNWRWTGEHAANAKKMALRLQDEASCKAAHRTVIGPHAELPFWSVTIPGNSF